jgi:SAM-dependent methyltransferase
MIIMSDIPTRETFESMYSGKAPWDIGRPQECFVEIADRVHGSILDAGCGTGENALFFAARGHAVVGIDYLEYPIAAAKQKAKERGLQVEFLQKDALTLKEFDRKFDSVIDSGLFHIFSDADRLRYIGGLTHVTRSGGRIYVACFSDEEPGTQGPRRVSHKELRDAFAGAWVIEEIRPVRFETRSDFQDLTFSEGGPRAWFLTAKRKG